MKDRPPIPAAVERQVLLEAGHRCAIPLCQQTPVEIAHIVPWTQVIKHTFDNLIALCPTCHTRYDSGGIDRKAMKQYKANLSILNGRYGDLEQRILRHFADKPGDYKIWLLGGLDILLMNLLKDGLLIDTGQTNGVSFGNEDFEIDAGKLYQLTAKGREFVQLWLAAKELT